MPFEGVQRHTGFKFSTGAFPLCRHPSSPLNRILTQHSILIACPVFGVHYKRRVFRVGLKQTVRPNNAEIVPFSFSPDHFTWTRATPFTVLVASTGLPSGVTSILRTM